MSPCLCSERQILISSSSPEVKQVKLNLKQMGRTTINWKDMRGWEVEGIPGFVWWNSAGLDMKGEGTVGEYQFPILFVSDHIHFLFNYL